MKPFKILLRIQPVLIIFLLAIGLFATFNIFQQKLQSETPKEYSDFNRFMYSQMNSDLFGDWISPNSTFFENDFGHAQYRLNGDQAYFVSSNFYQGVYSLGVTMNEKYKISTTNVAMTLVDGILDPVRGQLTFKQQPVEVEYVKISRNYFAKTCTVSGSLSFDSETGGSGSGLNHLIITIQSPDCQEANYIVVANAASAKVKLYQVHFHLAFTLLMLAAQAYFVARMEHQVQSQVGIGYQLSVMSVLTLATFQLFNGFEQFILSVLGYPVFGGLMLIGVGFLISFFQVVVRLMATLLQRQLNAQVDNNPDFSARTYLLLSYLVCHGTILGAFFASMEFSDNSKVYFFWLLSIVPQILKNLFSEYRFLERNTNMACFYFLVILFAVYQHFYRNNFAFVPNNNGFSERSGIEILMIALFACWCLAAQELGNYQRFFGALRGIQSWDYFRTLEQVKDEKGVSLTEVDCTICLGNMDATQSCNDFTAEIESDELKDYMRDVQAGPVMICPCKHIYHTGCLLSWMVVKMECPSCRAKLPPLI